MTRFGLISPLWLNFIVFGQSFEGLLRIWPNIKRALAKIVDFWTNFNCCKWPNIQKSLWPSGHTVRGPPKVSPAKITFCKKIQLLTQHSIGKTDRLRLSTKQG